MHRFCVITLLTRTIGDLAITIVDLAMTTGELKDLATTAITSKVCNSGFDSKALIVVTKARVVVTKA